MSAITRLQVALDHGTRETAYELIDAIQEDVDILEVGTPLLMRYGLSLVGDLADRYPSVSILCDAKIIDAAGIEARMCFDVGADYVTVLAVSDDLSVAACVAAARENGAQVMADMICVADLRRRAVQLADLGVDVIAVHTGVDRQARGETPLEDLRVLSDCLPGSMTAVAGGIDATSARLYLAYSPAIMIIGGALTRAQNPVETVIRLKSILRGNGL